MTTQVPTEKTTLLFVDAEKRVLNSMRVMFRRHYNLFLAGNVHDALKVINEQSVDVVIADDRMPDATGMEVLNWAHVRAPHSVRILLTDPANRSVSEAAIKRAQLFRLLSKPCHPDQLRLTIEQASRIAKLGRLQRVTGDSASAAVGGDASADAPRVVPAFNSHQAAKPSAPTGSAPTTDAPPVNDSVNNVGLNGHQAEDKVQPPQANGAPPREAPVLTRSLSGTYSTLSGSYRTFQNPNSTAVNKPEKDGAVTSPPAEKTANRKSRIRTILGGGHQAQVAQPAGPKESEDALLSSPLPPSPLTPAPTSTSDTDQAIVGDSAAADAPTEQLSNPGGESAQQQLSCPPGELDSSTTERVEPDASSNPTESSAPIEPPPRSGPPARSLLDMPSNEDNGTISPIDTPDKLGDTQRLAHTLAVELTNELDDDLSDELAAEVNEEAARLMDQQPENRSARSISARSIPNKSSKSRAHSSPQMTERLASRLSKAADRASPTTSPTPLRPRLSGAAKIAAIVAAATQRNEALTDEDTAKDTSDTDATAASGDSEASASPQIPATPAKKKDVPDAPPVLSQAVSRETALAGLAAATSTTDSTFGETNTGTTPALPIPEAAPVNNRRSHPARRAGDASAQTEPNAATPNTTPEPTVEADAPQSVAPDAPPESTIAPEAPAAGAADSAASADTEVLEPVDILVLTTDEIFVEEIREGLGDGLNIHTSNSVAGCIDLVCATGSALLLTDFSSKAAVLTRIVNGLRGFVPELAAIVVGDALNDQERAHLESSGLVAAYLEKPLSVAECRGAIERAIIVHDTRGQDIAAQAEAIIQGTSGARETEEDHARGVPTLSDRLRQVTRRWNRPPVQH